MAVTEDPLNEQQKVRAACVYAATRSLLTDDPGHEDIIAVASYIETGVTPQRPSFHGHAGEIHAFDEVQTWDAAEFKANADV